MSLDALSDLVIGFIAGVELFFFALLFDGWSRPWGRKLNGLSEARTRIEAPMAANLGLSHAFLATGCLSSLVVGDPLLNMALEILFLTFILLYGAYGGMTFRKWFFYLESLPALIALFLLWLRHPLAS